MAAFFDECGAAPGNVAALAATVPPSQKKRIPKRERSRFIGVTKMTGVTPRGDCFIAQIRVDRKTAKYLGKFYDDVEAARVFDAAARELGHKRLNFPS